MFSLEGIDHVALAVRDVPRSVAWYQEVLGLKRFHETVWGDHPAVIGLGSTALALFPAKGDEPHGSRDGGGIGMRHIAFRATSAAFEASKARLTNQGIDFDFEDHDIAHSIYFRDPDHYLIEITTYELGRLTERLGL